MDQLQLHVPRIEDLPYKTSPAIEFIYQSTATLNLGEYIWSDTPLPLYALRPLLNNAVYFFRSMTLTADIDEIDFLSNISDIPKFQMYLPSNANAILFREPIYMAKYFQNFDYRLAWNTHKNGDQLLASWNGTLLQGASLIGKTTITLTAVVSCQEIVDDNFIKVFRQNYPIGRL